MIIVYIILSVVLIAMVTLTIMLWPFIKILKDHYDDKDTL